jgi:tripartite motif-containing protein 71
VQRGKLYITDVGNNRLQVFDTNGHFLQVIGAEGPENGSFQRPRSVAVDSDDNIYVVDDLNRVQKFDAEGRFIRSWGRYGGMPGELAEPTDLSVVRDRVYVADTVNHRLQGFDLDGNLRVVWGRHPETAHEGMGHTHYPSSIKVSPDNSMAIVCEPFEYRCQLFDLPRVRTIAAANTNAWWEKFPRFHYGSSVGVKDPPDKLAKKRTLLIIGEPDLNRVVALSFDTSIRTLAAEGVRDGKKSVDIPMQFAIGAFGHGPGKFVTVGSIHPTNAGTLLVGDAGSNNIQEFDLLSGQFKRTLFGPGTGPGQFHGPSGIAETPDGEIYIGDFHNNRIQVFDRDYNFKRMFAETGDGKGQLFGPLSIVFDPKYERLYVTDTGNQRVVVFDRAGKFLFSFGRLTRPGEWGNGTFQWPFAVAVSNKGDVYVTDPSLQLVQKFDSDGKFVTQWGGWGTEPGQFYKCKGIDVDEEGNVYVIDFGNHRGQVFDANGVFLAIFGEGVLYPAEAKK